MKKKTEKLKHSEMKQFSVHVTGVDERLNMEGNVDYLLVLSYAPRGTLTDFLRAQTVDWPTFCKMGLSIVKGLAYLHTDIRKGGSHRYFSSIFAPFDRTNFLFFNVFFCYWNRQKN